MIDYTLLVYQLGGIALRNKIDMKTLHVNLAKGISEKIAEAEVSAAIEQLDTPTFHSNFLEKTQVQLITRHSMICP